MEKSLSKSLFTEVATRAVADNLFGTDWLKGYPLPNPDKVLRTNNVSYSVLDDLKTDPHIRSCIGNFKNGIKRLKWWINKDGESDANAERFKEDLKAMFESDPRGVSHIISELLNAFLYGFSVHEVRWQAKEGRIVPVGLIEKPRRWFSFTPENELLFHRNTDINGIKVPQYKFIVSTHESSYENPYGESILSSVFWAALFKKEALKLAVQFAEKYGMGYLHAQHDIVKSEDVLTLEDELKRLVRDGIAVTNKDVVINFLSAGLGSSESFYQVIALCKAEITEALLSHESATSSTPGRLGNDNMAMTVRQDALDAGTAIVNAAFNNLARMYYELNRLTTPVPSFGLYPEEDVDMAIAQRDGMLYAVGVRFTKGYIAKTYDLEEEDFDIAEDAPNPMLAGLVPPDDKGDKKPAKKASNTPLNPKDKAALAAGPQFASPNDAPTQIAVDDAADFIPATREATMAIETLLQNIEDYAGGVSSFEEALENLASVLPDMETDRLEDLLFRGVMTASTVGRQFTQG